MVPPAPGRPTAPLVFITGTDTGVGKTLLTALLLAHLQATGCAVRAIKPFCTGGTEDLDLLQALQPEVSTRTELAHFYSPAPVAPLAAARLRRQSLCLPRVLAWIRAQQKTRQRLLVEGSGGVLVPLGRGFFIADLIASLGGAVLVVAQDRIGVLNQVLLTVSALRHRGVGPVKVVLMGTAQPDLSTRTNQRLLAALTRPDEVYKVPYLGPHVFAPESVRAECKKLKKTLARLL
jgi:dethiobiotin synthetase